MMRVFIHLPLVLQHHWAMYKYETPSHFNSSHIFSRRDISYPRTHPHSESGRTEHSHWNRIQRLLIFDLLQINRSVYIFMIAQQYHPIFASH